VLDQGLAQQPQRRPWIIRESGLDCLLTFVSDDEQDLLPVAKWAAQDDESVVCEDVHERGVLLPLLPAFALEAWYPSTLPVLG